MKAILEILEQNARATPAQIAAIVGKPVREVQKIIRQAEIKVSGLIDATSVWVTHEYLFLR